MEVKRIKAVLSNQSHPDYGQVTVPFPIPDEEYDHVIELLESLKIGDIRAYDCHVDEVIDCPPVLNRLNGTQINIDELDYLAKLLDSFVAKELAAFQGMVEKLGYIEVFDMINLSFYCDQVTVITDFSDLAAIGRNHVLAQQMAVTADELEKMDLAEIGKELIASGKGAVTPYGIIFDNDVDILSLYNCEAFPEHHYKASNIDVAVFSPLAYTSTLAFYLPASRKQIERTLQRFLQFEREDFQLCVKETNTPVPEAWREHLFAQSEIYAYNDAAAAMAKLEESQYEKFSAVLKFTNAKTPSQVRQVAENLEMFEYIPGAQTAEDVGRALILDSGHFEVDPELEDYINFEAYGYSHIRCDEGSFGPYGYVSYTGDDRLFFEPEQQAADHQMGGMT